MDESRREFLKKAGIVSAATVVAGSIPAVAGLVLPPNKKVMAKQDTSGVVEIGLVEKLKQMSEPTKVNYETTLKDGWVESDRKGFVYVRTQENGNLLVMSPTCTHLGCTVPLNAERGNSDVWFKCPCHGGEYNKNGINIGGPPPRPFDIYKPAVKDGKAYINILITIQRKKPEK